MKLREKSLLSLRDRKGYEYNIKDRKIANQVVEKIIGERMGFSLSDSSQDSKPPVKEAPYSDSKSQIKYGGYFTLTQMCLLHKLEPEFKRIMCILAKGELSQSKLRESYNKNRPERYKACGNREQMRRWVNKLKDLMYVEYSGGRDKVKHSKNFKEPELFFKEPVGWIQESINLPDRKKSN